MGLLPAATLVVLGAGSLAVAAGAAPTQTPRRTHARVTLLAEHTALDAAGRPTMLGLDFQMADGWHIYWRNPGASGTPPTVTWHGEGLTFGPIEWPVPTRIDTEGVTSYGYAHDVLLLVPVHRTGTGPAPTRAAIAGTVDYVTCSDVCVKETASVSLTQPVRAGAAARSAEAARFAETRTRLPKTAPAAWSASAVNGDNEFTLSVRTGRPEQAATFFPFQEGLIDEAAVERLEPQPHGLVLHLRKSPYFNHHPPASLDGVLVLADRQAYTIAARLGSSGPHDHHAQGERP
jgi:DsbC/DsbD-like thiol-disulfide interchange protein